MDCVVLPTIRGRWKSWTRCLEACASAVVGLASVLTVQAADKPLSIAEARVCVTGADHNRPPDFPGIGDFIGWPGGVERMPNGDLLLGHSAGYWHSSFAQPRQIEPKLKKQWASEGWPVDFPAPTGGRVMACRSTDNGRTWTGNIPLDPSSYGYPGSYILERDQTILLPYCASGRAPNRVYLVRFRINAARNAIELLPLVRN